jgi:hypothetical protein
MLTIHIYLVPRLRMSDVEHLLLVNAWLNVLDKYSFTLAKYDFDLLF